MPLPNDQILPTDIVIDGTNTIFTVNTTGRYRLSYFVNITVGAAIGTRLLINGSGNTASTISPLVTLSSFSNEIMLDLIAGTTVSLQLFGLATIVTLLTGGLGASLMITRLS